MREEETIDDRAMRVLHDAETTHNTAKKAIIPLIPFGKNGAGIVIRDALPSECRYMPRTCTEEFFDVDGEARLDFDCDERSNDSGGEFMGDRETIVSLEDIMHLDRLRIGYNEHDVVRINNRSEVAISETLPVVESNDESYKNPKSVNLFDEEVMDTGTDIDLYEVDDILKPMYGPVITPTQSLICEENICRLGISRSDSTDSDVSSVFSTTSTVMSTPSIMKLKDRKRRLERFLSQKSFESAAENFQTSTIKGVSLPTSVSAQAC